MLFSDLLCECIFIADGFAMEPTEPITGGSGGFSGGF